MALEPVRDYFRKRAPGDAFVLALTGGMVVWATASRLPTVAVVAIGLGVFTCLALIAIHWERLRPYAGVAGYVLLALAAFGVPRFLEEQRELWARPSVADFNAMRAERDNLQTRSENLAGENVVLRARINDRAERDSINAARLSTTVDATELERGGQALLKRCCQVKTSSPDTILMADIKAWRRRVQSFLQRTNPAFRSEVYGDQVGEPLARAFMECVGGFLNAQMWEIEQDLRALGRVRGEAP